MSRVLKYVLSLSLCMVFTSCEKKRIEGLCRGANVYSYTPEFQIFCPTQGNDYYIPAKYGCSPYGEGISPPIEWKGVPEGTTHLRIMVIDATCTYECNDCCQFHHWILELPIKKLPEKGPVSRSGIEEGAAREKLTLKYTQKNTLKKKAYVPFCPPVIQTHAYVYQVIAYNNDNGKRKILGRSQSMPLLFSLEHK